MDPMFLAMSFKGPIYFVASDMVMSINFWSRIIKYLVSPIAKTKYRSDMETIKDIMKMVKSGGSIAIFPEGNTSFSGANSEIPLSTAKLAKKLKIPVVLYNIEGGYLTHPRWAKNTRKGVMRGFVKDVISPNQLKTLSVNEIDSMITKTLEVNDYNVMKGIEYRGKDKALYLENAIYYCPNCHSFHTIKTQKDTVYCEACDLRLTIDNYGEFKGDPAFHFFQTPMPWFEAQKEAIIEVIHQLTDEDILFEDDVLEVLDVKRNVSKQPIGKATIRLFKTILTITFLDNVLTWNVSDLSFAVQQKNKLIIYNKTTDQTYYFLSHERFNAYKYVEALTRLKGDGNNELK